MFPNVRLMIAAVIASIVALSCGFGVFAALRVNHEPLARLPPASAPLQLVVGNAMPLPMAIAAIAPAGRGLHPNDRLNNDRLNNDRLNADGAAALPLSKPGDDKPTPAAAAANAAPEPGIPAAEPTAASVSPPAALVMASEQPAPAVTDDIAGVQDHVAATPELEPASTDRASAAVSSQDTSAQDTSAQDTSAQDTSAQDTSAQDTSAQDTSAQDTSAQVTSAQETPVQDTPAQGAPVQDTRQIMAVLDSKAEGAAAASAEPAPTAPPPAVVESSAEQASAAEQTPRAAEPSSDIVPANVTKTTHTPAQITAKAPERARVAVKLRRIRWLRADVAAAYDMWAFWSQPTQFQRAALFPDERARQMWWLRVRRVKVIARKTATKHTAVGGPFVSPKKHSGG